VGEGEKMARAKYQSGREKLEKDIAILKQAFVGATTHEAAEKVKRAIERLETELENYVEPPNVGRLDQALAGGDIYKPVISKKSQ
jgi:plasmid stabilization system protein ParE